MYTPLYFTPKEFRQCRPGCEISDMDENFLIKLDLLRAKCGFPFRLNSAYRSLAHEFELGRSGKSMHVEGRAVDISCTDPFKRASIVHHALLMGLRVGISPVFIHVDDKKSEKIIWTYQK